MGKSAQLLPPVLAFTFFSLALVCQFTNSSEDPKTDVLVHKVAYLVMMLLALCMPILGWRYRKLYSEVIEFVNLKCQESLQRKDAKELRPLRNKIYLLMISIPVLSVPMVLFALSPILMETLWEGRLYFETVSFGEEYSFSVHLQCALELLIFSWNYCFCTLFIVLIIEPFLRLGHLFKIIAIDLLSLRKENSKVSELEEYQRLKSLMKQYGDVERFAIEF